MCPSRNEWKSLPPPASARSDERDASENAQPVRDLLCSWMMSRSELRIQESGMSSDDCQH